MQMSALTNEPIMQMVAGMTTITETSTDHQPRLNPEMRQAQEW
jgi:hypothetical protein